MKRVIFLVVAICFPLFSCSPNNENPTKETYTIRWLNYDDSLLEEDLKVEEGVLPTYDGITPTRNEDLSYTYEFDTWSPKVVAAKEDTSYKATYIAHPKSLDILASQPSGFYNDTIIVSLSTLPGCEIYYSFDNSEPTINSTKYTKSFNIKNASDNPNVYSAIDNISSIDVFIPSSKVDKGTILKAIAYNPTTGETSSVKSWHYFVGFNDNEYYKDMPVISMSVEPDDLFDYERGIYVTGKIYDESPHEGYPETWPANYTQKGKEWERRADFVCFNEDKSLDLEQQIGIRIHGGWSRAFNQKSFNLYARKEYSGTSTFNKAFFGDIKAHSLMLRSGGYRDTYITKVRDSLNQTMSVDEGFCIQRSKPYIVFLNGEYWGIYNLQERFSDNYVAERTGVNKKKVLIIKNDEIDEGEESDYHYYLELWDFFRDTDFENVDIAEVLPPYINVNEFASYMATQLYVGNIDWPGNNVRMYREVNTENSQWHFMMYDTDDSSDIFPSKCSVDKNPFENINHWKYGPLDDRCILGLMFTKLLDNADFRQIIYDAFYRVGSSNFDSLKVNSYLDEKCELLKTPMINNSLRFISDEIISSNKYENDINVIKEYFANRYDYAMKYLEEVINEYGGLL